MLAAAQLLFTYLPAMNRLFATVPLGPADLLTVAACGLLLMLLLEIEKAVLRRLNGAAAPS